MAGKAATRESDEVEEFQVKESINDPEKPPPETSSGREARCP